jgi:drug/metabolite transporter (DMT)-like permease
LIILFSRLYAGEERPTSIRDLGTRPIAAVLLVLGVLLVVGPRPGAGLLALLIGLALLAAGLVWLFPGLTGSTRSRQSAPASESGDGPPGPSGSEVGSEPSPHD